MAINWDLYSTRLKIDGNTFKERQINSMVNAINGSFESNPSYFEVSINGNSTLTGVQIVDNSSNESSKIDYIRKIIMKPTDSISVGDIVDWDSKKWLVVTAEKFSDIYWYGMMQECNNTLRFYNKTGILFTVPCIFTDISIDLHEGRLMNLPIGHYNVIIPSGYVTKEDMDLRFCLNDSAYKIEGISTATNGLTKIEVEDDQFTPDDNRTLGICNYWSNQPTSPDSETIVISPIDTSIDIGSTMTFTASVFIDGIENNTERTIWLLTNKDGSYLPYCTMSYDNRTCTLVSSPKPEYVGKVINLKVVLENNHEVFVNKEVTITSFI